MRDRSICANYIKVMGIISEEATLTIFASLCSGGQLLKGQLLKARICSCRSKFLLSRADPTSESYIIQRRIQEFM